MNLIELKILLRVLDRESVNDLHIAEASEPNLTPAETLVLTAVAQRGPIAVGELASATGFVQSYISSIVARLEERGMVSHAADPEDRRRTLVSFHPTIQKQVMSALSVDARPLFERLLGSDSEYSVDEVLAVLEYLARTVRSNVPAPEGMPSGNQ